MKFIVVVLAAVLLAGCVLSAGIPSSPGFCHDKPDGKYPVKDNCRQYWDCKNHVTKKSTCPTGQYYDEHKHGCVAGSCPKSGEGFCRDKPDGKYPVKDNCRQYWECKNHETKKSTCPTGQYYDDHKHGCVAGSCPKSGEGFCHDKPDGKYPVKDNCRQYWDCKNHVTKKVFCPPGQKYDAPSHKCVNGKC